MSESTSSSIADRGYARPDVLVSTDWVAKHLDDPDVRLAESNEDPLVYPSNHIPGAVEIDWTRDLNDPLTRAQSCAQCHVGSPHREVNHDLIAAGHPRLNYEHAAYHGRLHKHWRDEQDRRNNPEYELQLWAAGQLGSAEAALKLLQWRAGGGEDEQTGASDNASVTTKPVWPEFAEYECSACHHNLSYPSWRQASSGGRERPERSRRGGSCSRPPVRTAAGGSASSSGT